VGGKERKNNLKVFDLEAQKQIFSSKNVPHDNLQLEVPVWESDMAFVNNSENCLATCSRHGYIRLYDNRQQRRPVKNYTDPRDQAFNSMAEHDGIVYVGTTNGCLYAFDLKSLKVPLHTYKGAVGSITSIAIDETGKFVFASSLDRYIRAYDVEKTQLLYQCYVKSKASEIIMKSADQRLLEELSASQLDAQKRAAEGSDEEYDNIFGKMQKVEDGEKSIGMRVKSLRKSQMKRHSGIVFKT
jgi:ribosome biogenesis protein NSA1